MTEKPSNKATAQKNEAVALEHRTLRADAELPGHRTPAISSDDDNQETQHRAGKHHQVDRQVEHLHVRPFPRLNVVVSDGQPIGRDRIRSQPCPSQNSTDNDARFMPLPVRADDYAHYCQRGNELEIQAGQQR